MKAYLVDNSILKKVNLELPHKMKSTDIYLRQKYTSINRFDTLVAFSLLKLNQNSKKFIPGSNAFGESIKIGSAVDNKFKKVPYIYYIMPQYGSYCQNRVVSSTNCVGIKNEDLDPKVISACIFNAFEASVLCDVINNVNEKRKIIINNISDATNHILAQLAYEKGAKVVGIINNKNIKKSNLDYIKKYVCEDIFFSADEALDVKVLEILGSSGADIVYDNLGDIFFNLNKLCKEVGSYILYDNALFEMNNFNMSVVCHKSISYRAFKYHVYAADSQFIEDRVNSVLNLINKEKIKPIINFYSFSDIPHVNEMIFNNISIGCNLVTI